MFVCQKVTVVWYSVVTSLANKCHKVKCFSICQNCSFCAVSFLVKTLVFLGYFFLQNFESNIRFVAKGCKDETFIVQVLPYCALQ